jgi:hypothetical protein
LDFPGIGGGEMDIDDYLEAIDHIAQAFVMEVVPVHELVQDRSVLPELLAEALAFRLGFLSEADRHRLGPFLEIGFFPDKDSEVRLASYAVAFEVQEAVDRLRLWRQCEPYSLDQPLFRAAPSLFDHVRGPKNEIMDIVSLRQVDESEIFEVPNGHSRLTGFLSPAVVNLTQTKYPNATIYIRLDPYDFHVQRPLRRLDEAAVIPPNPRWLASFNLRKGMKDRSHYVLEEADPKTDMARWWDYSVRHVRRLECRVERREHDYLTMMVEELPRCDDPSGLMIGRCVHLDTKDPAGTQPAAVVLAHLDLAINVYEGNRRKERWDARLADGKVPDASFRTHLFRVEAVPLARVFDYCRLFFRSGALFDEWLQDLDPGSIFSPSARAPAWR